jgi:hypothetical protein
LKKITHPKLTQGIMSQPFESVSREGYPLAPEEPLQVSSASACTSKLTKQKREAVKAYLNTLGPALQQKYGRSPHYTPVQVRETALERGLSIDYMCWAFLLYCAQPDFLSIHSVAGEICDYSAMREVVAGAFFGGNVGFDATEVAAVIAAGSAEAISSAAGGVTSWLVDVDWSSLVDWA